MINFELSTNFEQLTQTLASLLFTAKSILNSGDSGRNLVPLGHLLIWIYICIPKRGEMLKSVKFPSQCIA
jgi:hypothetical protein